MAFCTNCGRQVAGAARFCVSCGAALAVAATVTAAASTPELEYDIIGDNLQAVRIRLKPGQELYAEAGKMLYKTAAIQWQTQMKGRSIGEKIWGAVKRKISGESLFLTYYRATHEGEVGFAGDYPGRIQAFNLAPGQAILVQRDSFVCGQSSVDFSIAFMRKLGAGLFGGEGFILQKLTGPGTVFIHAGGDHIDWNLRPGETLQVDTGCVVAFEETVNYDIQYVGGIKTALFGGEGFFLTTLTGPGRAIIQTLTLEKLRRQMRPTLSGGDERGALGSLTGILRSED